MLHINLNTPKIIKAKRAFHTGMLDFVFKRIGKIGEGRRFDERRDRRP